MSHYQDYDSAPEIQDAIDFLKTCNEAETTNRQEALEDLKFASGDQWPVEIQNSRTLEARPCLTINKIGAFCRQVVNNIRQQRPRIQVHGTNTQSDEKVAQVNEGIIRHIQVNSDADQAYDNAVDFAVRMGWGYWRVNTDYISDDSFDQEIFIEQIVNPFTVYFDPNSVAPDGSDAEKVLITEVISKDVFRKMYPDADDGSFTNRGTGDTDSNWVMKNDIRIAEYFYTKRTKTKLLKLIDGSEVYEDEFEGNDDDVVDVRETVKKVIHWCKLTSMEVLETAIWPGKYIPIIPVIGEQLIVENKKKRFGLVRQAKDPQRMYNFWQTAFTESVALAPKAKWLIAEGQDEGHENEWMMANVKAYPVLRYKQKDIEGNPAPVPTRVQPEAPPAGVMAASEQINSDLKSVVGIFDPSQLNLGNISGKALNGQQQQSDMSNWHFYDNLTRSMRWTGKVILDLIPKIYDTERVMRIIGVDGKPELTTINQRVTDEQTGVEKVLNDVTVGRYDVVMETGPGFNSKRQEAVAAMMPLLSQNEQLFQTAGDLVFRNMDFPGADVIADRLAATNPLAQIDEKSDIPPQVQMQLQQNQAQMQQMQQLIQQLQLDIKHGATVKGMQEQAETQRELMRQTAKAHNTETMAEVRVNDQNTRAITSQNKIEIEAITDLLLAHMDTSRLEREIAARNQEQYQYMTEAAQDISSGANPLTQQGIQ
jgi:hypothetical protein